MSIFLRNFVLMAVYISIWLFLCWNFWSYNLYISIIQILLDLSAWYIGFPYFLYCMGLSVSVGMHLFIVINFYSIYCFANHLSLTVSNYFCLYSDFFSIFFYNLWSTVFWNCLLTFFCILYLYNLSLFVNYNLILCLSHLLGVYLFFYYVSLGILYYFCINFDPLLSLNYYLSSMLMYLSVWILLPGYFSALLVNNIPICILVGISLYFICLTLFIHLFNLVTVYTLRSLTNLSSTRLYMINLTTLVSFKIYFYLNNFTISFLNILLMSVNSTVPIFLKLSNIGFSL